jgi:2'-5' RNA ligase
MPRLFVGVDIPPACRERAAVVRDCLAGRLASDICWTRPDSWHLTLKFLGEVEPGAVEAVVSALGAVECPAFAARLGGCGTFPPLPATSATSGTGRGRIRPPRVLWLGLDRGGHELVRLAEAVDRALAPLGFAPAATPHHPHLTLGRVRRAAPDRWAEALAACDAAHARAGDWPEFTVDGFILWRSDLMPDGARHTAVGRFGG